MIITALKLLKQAESYFNNRSDAEYFIQSLLQKPRYLIYQDILINETEILTRYHQLIKSYKPHMPIAYLVKKAYFMNFELYVDGRVLIPRPETELLIEKTTDLLSQYQIKPKTILDLGTGSGNIAIALAKIYPQAQIIAADISEDALAVSEINIKKYHLSDRIKLIKSNLFLNLNTKFELIISNPPYLDNKEIENLPYSVKNYEPVIALNGGSDGFEIIKQIIEQAPNYLTAKSLLALEINPQHGELLNKLSTSIILDNDYNNLIRFAFIINTN